MLRPRHYRDRVMKSELINTTWLTEPNLIGGLDHLGVQAPCINIYSQLMPGITNVTDRARYYSFYPWLLTAMDEDDMLKGKDYINYFRNADCLLTLVCLRHGDVCNDGLTIHSAGTVGSLALSHAIKSLSKKNSIKLSEYSTKASVSSRYFKNSMGGLGQYYKGVLRELNIMGGNSKDDLSVIKQTGGLLAKKLAAHLPVDLFLKTVKSGSVNSDTLDKLSPFCFCQLHKNTAEREVLTSMFLGEGAFSGMSKTTDDDSKRRCQSLSYFLLMSKEMASHGSLLEINSFRSLIYTRSISSKRPLPIPKLLNDVASGWASYQRNELYSIALQGLFYASLRDYEKSGVSADHEGALAAWFWKKGEGSSALKKLQKYKTFKQMSKGLIDEMPNFTDWECEDHEMDHMEKISVTTRIGASSKQQLFDVVIRSIHILAALYGRKENRDGYGNLYFTKGYFDHYPVNLNSFFHKLDNEWADLPLQECMINMLLHWCLKSHLRVALRKLRNQSQSTFRFIPTDQGIKIIDIPPAVHTSPRYRQTMTILEDIGLLQENMKGLKVPTPAARLLLV